MAKARWNGVTLAESEQCTVIEGNYYFPPDYVRLLFHSKPVLSGPDNLVATILMGRI
jgi:nucleotidyltransferase-like protein